RYSIKLGIPFAEVATHNHFVLDRGGKVFKQTAPVIKLPDGATEDQHLQLLGVLNSSTACFWLKQVAHNKGSTVDSHGARQTQVPWEDFYQFNSTKVGQFPVHARLPLERARILDALGQELIATSPASVVSAWCVDR
ncbi:SAM-dependent methyltransferase, partial [Mycobacterium sp. ITM-2017-0098]